MNQKQEKNSYKLASRLGDILTRLNNGESLDTKELAQDYAVHERTIARDMHERLGFLIYDEESRPKFRLDRKKFGILSRADIIRFANFASIGNLFPKIDRDFYEEKLRQSVQVKGFQYEDIQHFKQEFDLLKSAVENHRVIEFRYRKNSSNESKYYRIAPYALLNKNGIWYLIGTDNGKQKTFCFTQMSMIRALTETFTPNEQLKREIIQNDSISHGNQLAEVVVQVSKFAAPYFLRRNLLPNQELVRKLNDGGLLLVSKNINEMDIIPLVQYWIPHLVVISPVEIQNQIIHKLQQYLIGNN